MGLSYRVLDEPKWDRLTYSSDDIIVEIGSERGEGSTKYLSDIAEQKGIDFYSIDVDAAVINRVPDSKVKFEIVTSGHQWCKDILPTINKKIKILYLDNFDWIYAGKENSLQVKQQIDEYALRGVEMNNDASAEEHRLQLYYAMPFLSDECLVIMDDTFYDINKKEKGHSPQDCYSGKCGTCISMLIENKFVLENIPNIAQTSDIAHYAYRSKNKDFQSSNEL